MEIRVKTIDEFRSERVTIEVAPGQRAEIEIVDGEVSKREHLFTSDEVAHYQSTEAELVAGPLRARINELERTLAASVKREADLETKVDGYDHDRHTERDRADRERQRASELKDRLSSSEELVQEERIRGNNLAERLAKAVKALAESRDLVAFKNRILNDKDDELREVRGHADQLKKRAEDAESKLLKGHVCTGGCSDGQHVAFVGRKALTEAENQVAALTRQIDNARVLLSDARVVDARNKSVTTRENVLGEAIEKALDTLTWH